MAAASKSGRPPPESAPRVRATGALTCVLTTHKNVCKSILVTDGAPCYPKLTCEHNLGHEACNHRWCRWNVENFQRCSAKFLEHTQKWNCKSSVASRNSNLAAAMAPWKFQGLHESHRSRQAAMTEVRSDHHPKATKPFKYHETLQQYSIFPGKMYRNMIHEMCMVPQCQIFFPSKRAQPTCSTASAVSRLGGRDRRASREILGPGHGKATW